MVKMVKLGKKWKSWLKWQKVVKVAKSGKSGQKVIKVVKCGQNGMGHVLRTIHGYKKSAQNMTSGVSYNRFAPRAQIRVRTRILKNFCGFGSCTQNHTRLQNISSKYGFWGEL